MSNRFGRHLIRTIAPALGAVVLVFSMPAPPASAQGLLEALFGGFRRASHDIQRALPYADPFENERRRPSGEQVGGGGGQAYCVRTCDGRFFPLQRQAGASPAETCNSFCPSAKTMVFYGGKIDHAVSGNTRYSDLQNAFLFRERVVDNCTCNGRDAFGLARLDVAEDKTLKPGDIVATNDGLATYRGRDRNKTAQFSPINPNSSAWARQLAQTKVMPMPEVEKVEPVARPVAEAPRERRNANRNVQLIRN